MLQIAFLLIALATSGYANLSESLTLAEQQRIYQSLSQNPSSLQDLYYTAGSLLSIRKSIHDVPQACNLAKSAVLAANAESSDAVSMFQYAEVVKSLQCPEPVDLKATLETLVSTESSSSAISHAVAAMALLGYEVGAGTITKFVDVAKDNDTPASASISFYTASLLPKSGELKSIVDMVEDIIAQADEIDGKMLQFEGGLQITSGVVRGIIALSEQQDRAIMKQDAALKLTRFLLSRKYVFALKDIHSLLTALSALSTNKHQIPLVLSVFEKSAITKETPLLKVRVTNVIDQSIEGLKVTVKQLKSSDGEKLIENTEMKKSAEGDFIRLDSDIASGFVAAKPYELNVIAATSGRGHYTASLSVTASEKKYLSSGAFDVACSVLSKIVVKDVKVGIVDSDAKNPSSTTDLKFMEKLPNVIDADYQQKIVMSFALTEMDGDKRVTAHQTFVRLVQETSGQEIFFVAEPDSDNNYKFTLDIGATAKDSFNNLSGNYKMSLIVGDSTVEVPIHWSMGVLSLKFKDSNQKQKDAASPLKPQPVIEHMFRVPEKRPSKLVSTIFTALIFVPFLIMIGVWMKVGANISNFQLSISAILFHVGLAGIFGLYYLFWIQFDMFQTLKLLMLVGGLTFLGGNSMLAKMAAERYRQ